MLFFGFIEILLWFTLLNRIEVVGEVFFLQYCTIAPKVNCFQLYSWDIIRETTQEFSSLSKKSKGISLPFLHMVL